MKDSSVSTGVILATSQIKALGERGLVTFAQETGGGTAILRDGDGTGKILASFVANESFTWDSPVRYTDGLHVTIIGGAVVVHIG